MKKIFLILCSFMISFIFIGCSDKNKENLSSSGKKVIYTTFFPVKELTQKIVGDKMEIRTIIDGSQEPHDFELKAEDMAKITKADLIIYNGAKMESFIENLENAIDDKNKFLDLSQGLSLLEGKDSEKGEHNSVNPHTWLSIKNAMIELDTIYKKIVSIDPDNKDYYKNNLDKALEEFSKLDKKFEEKLSNVKSKEKYFVVSHAAFNYLANDYGLKQVAVTGISPDEEPSAKELKIIADFVNKNHIKTIFFEGKATPKVAKTLSKETGVKTATLYTMENLTDEEIKEGYLKLMERNLEELVKSLNE